MKRNVRNFSFVLISLIVMFSTSGCDPFRNVVADTTAQLEQLATRLQQDGVDWQFAIADTLKQVDSSEKQVISQLKDLLDQAKQAAISTAFCIFSLIHSSLSADVERISAQINGKSLPARKPTICSNSANSLDFNKDVPTTITFNGFDLDFNALSFRIRELNDTYKGHDLNSGLANAYTYTLSLVNSNGDYIIDPATDKSIDIFDSSSGVPIYSIIITAKRLPSCNVIEIRPDQLNVTLGDYVKLYGDNQYGNSGIIVSFKEYYYFYNYPANEVAYQFTVLLTEDYYGNTDQTITQFSTPDLYIKAPSPDYHLYGYSTQDPLSSSLPVTTYGRNLTSTTQGYIQHGYDPYNLDTQGGFVSSVTISNTSANNAPAVIVVAHLNPYWRIFFKQATNCK